VLAALIASIGLSGCGGGAVEAESGGATVVADTTSPSMPNGLNASAVAPSQINLSWSASTDNVAVTGYRVYRGGTLLATLGSATTYQNTGLAGATTYSYTVQAYDGAGNMSAQTAAAIVTTPATPDTTAPSTPGGLTANAVSTSQINLGWTASTDNVGVTGYRVYRGGTLLVTLGNVTSYQNTGLTAATTYSYTVQALDAAGNASGQSTAAVATTPAIPDVIAPTTPTGLTATAVSSSQINLSWTASTDNVGVTGYRVYRGGTFLVTLGNVTTYQNTGLTASTTYSYNVDAIDAAGNASGISTAASATTSASTPPNIIWQAHAETGNFSEWTGDGGGDMYRRINDVDVISPDALAEISQEQAHSGQRSVKFSINTDPSFYPNSPKGQVVRWNEPRRNTDLYYSVWYFIPQAFNGWPNGQGEGWLNMFQFHSVSETGGRTHSGVVLFGRSNRNTGANYFELSLSSDYGNNIGALNSPVNMPIGRWFNVEMRMKCAANRQGVVQVWQDGQEIFNLQNVTTNRSESDADCHWMVNAYGQWFVPSPTVFYVDDLIISTTRVWQ
jgi:chitodextrinase